MPLVGLIDPSHTERAADEPGRLPSWMPVDEVLEKALTGNPKWSPYPFELIQSAMNEWQERDYISSTMLTGGCSRGKVIERKADFVGDIDSMYASLRGTLIHRTLEQVSRPNAVAEYRFFTDMEVGGKTVEVSCSPDVLIYEGETGIWDWKTTEKEAPAFGYPYKSHRNQLQFNRYIVNSAKRWVDAEGNEVTLPFSPWDLEFKHLTVVYLAPKGPKVIECMASKDVKTPNDKTIRRKMPDVWDGEKALGVMMPRLTAMVRALDAYPEWPFTEEEMADEDPKNPVTGFGGPAGWGCPGYPWCLLPNCIAKRWPNGLTW
jgi:hypothetical protein